MTTLPLASENRRRHPREGGELAGAGAQQVVLRREARLLGGDDRRHPVRPKGAPGAGAGAGEIDQLILITLIDKISRFVLYIYRVIVVSYPMAISIFHRNINFDHNTIPLLICWLNGALKNNIVFSLSPSYLKIIFSMLWMT